MAAENLEATGRNQGSDKDDLIFLIQTAKRLSTEDSLEAFLDFVLQHDVNNEWAEELFTSAFMLFAHALQNEKLKMKAYQALDLTKVLHGHELCILLGETLMRDFTEGPSTVRLAALHATLTLIHTEECRSDVLLKALNDPDPTIRLRALVFLLDASRGVTEGKGNRPKVYEAALKRLMSKALGAELSLTLQALVLLSEPEDRAKLVPRGGWEIGRVPISFASRDGKNGGKFWGNFGWPAAGVPMVVTCCWLMFQFSAFRLKIPRTPGISWSETSWARLWARWENFKRFKTATKKHTLPETNIPETRPSQKEFHLPTIHFQGLC